MKSNSPNVWLELRKEMIAFDKKLQLDRTYLDWLLHRDRNKHDDWALIIKLVAYLESALTESIYEKSGAITDKDKIAKMPLAGVRNSKVYEAQELEILDLKHVSFLRAIAKVRNRYAHNIADVFRTLPEISNEMNDQVLVDLIGEDFFHLRDTEGFNFWWRLGVSFKMLQVMVALLQQKLPENTKSAVDLYQREALERLKQTWAVRR